MTSKVLLNNVKLYKKREASLDQYSAYSKINHAQPLKLPQIPTQGNNCNITHVQAQPA